MIILIIIDWMEIYKKLVYWELEMKKSDSPEMQEVFQSQKNEANTEFFKFISKIILTGLPILLPMRLS